MRDSLNKVNTVFSEDTQRGTDRIVRIILQGTSNFSIFFFFLLLLLLCDSTLPASLVCPSSMSPFFLKSVPSLFTTPSQSLNSHINLKTDVNELEVATRQRPGTNRSESKLKLINKKLKKLDAAFSELLTYF